MALIDIDLNPDESILRSFGWIALVGFGLLAGVAWLEVLIFSFGLGAARVPVAAGFGALGLVSAFFSLLRPAWNRLLYVGLSVITFPIGFVLSYVILAFLFYGVIAPVGFGLRIFGRDPLDRRFLPDATTYWVDAGPPRPKDSYFKQF